jgi:hypothetical protein
VKRISTLVVLVLIWSLAPLTAAHAAPSVRTVHREYGDGPVRVASARGGVDMVFHGRTGDRVLLDGTGPCRPALLDDEGAGVQPRSGGYWRLPGSGRYVFEHRPCAGLDEAPTLQLTKVSLRRPVTNHRSVALPAPRRGFLSAVEVVVPADGRLRLDAEPDVRWRRVLYVDGRRVQVDSALDDYILMGDASYVFEAGRPAVDVFERVLTIGGKPLVMHAGQHILLSVADAATVQATSALRRQVSVDGPAFAMYAGRRLDRERSLEFDGSAGQYVHLEVDGPLELTPGSMQGPTGDFLPVPDGTSYNGLTTYWRLPTAGRYRLLLTVDHRQGPVPSGTTSDVRLRSIREVGALPADGSSSTMATTAPGEWVLATVPVKGATYYNVTATARSATSTWRVYVQPLVPHCPNFYLGTSMGYCGDYTYVESGGPATQPVWDGHSADHDLTAVLMVPPGETATVDVHFDGTPWSAG